MALLNASNSVPEILSDFSSSSVVDLLLILSQLQKHRVRDARFDPSSRVRSIRPEDRVYLCGVRVLIFENVENYLLMV